MHSPRAVDILLASLFVSDKVVPMRFRPHIRCPYCEYPMSRQKDTNFKCLVPTCGKGYLRTQAGIKVHVEGDAVIFEAGGSEDDIT